LRQDHFWVLVDGPGYTNSKEELSEDQNAVDEALRGLRFTLEREPYSVGRIVSDPPMVIHAVQIARWADEMDPLVVYYRMDPDVDKITLLRVIKQADL
jgi:hypothetical protein